MGYCPLADKECELETPAYDCPYFDYSDHYLAALGVKKKEGNTKNQNKIVDKEESEEKNEVIIREQVNTVDVNDKDLRNRGNFTLAVVVFLFCIISTAFVVSHAHGLEIVSDIVIGLFITAVLTYLAYEE
jgi:hypothetical protein